MLFVVALVLTLSADTSMIDSFDSVSQWTTNPAKGVEISIHSDSGRHGRALRVDFDFHGNPGYGIVRRDINLDLPPNYEFAFAVRGEAPKNTLEFKLVDRGGATVWWSNNPNFDFPREWRSITRKKREICYAWGPMPRSGQVRHLGAIEFAITAGTGGKGSVWIDDLSLTQLDPDSPFAFTQPSASAPIVGTWESAPTPEDPTGAKLDIGADGSFTSTNGIMATFAYSIDKDQMRTDFRDPGDPKNYKFTTSFRIENDSFVQKGVNLFGQDVTMKKVSAKPGGPPISGVWSYADYTEATAYVAFGDDGRGFFRVPLGECSGTWKDSGGHLIVALNGQIAERDYSIDKDVLTLVYPGPDMKYNRRTRAP
ncbi:MAG TPA: hypothetical protein VK575_10780 [Gemmatimonadaceae bacterium]|nr:hypothetical protein [Gemmatimonadaceae bacterium]